MENDLAYLDGLVSKVLLAVYPIGSIYCSLSDADPATLFGGTWEKVSSGRVLQGADSTHAAGSTAEAGLPNITGTHQYVASGYGIQNSKSTGAFANDGEHSATDGYVHSNSTDGTLVKNFNINASRSSPVYGASTTVQPPAYFVNIWKRTA